jgi:hypothetical protein
LAPAYTQSICFVGRTYEYKTRLTRLGARWIAGQKAWVMPAADTQEQRTEQVRVANELAEAGVAVHLETATAQGDIIAAA